MKLYATTTSNRATKGQGGDYLNIQLQGEDRQSLGVISLRLIDNYYIGIYHYNNTGVNFLRIEKEKGKSQKGECKY